MTVDKGFCMLTYLVKKFSFEFISEIENIADIFYKVGNENIYKDLPLLFNSGKNGILIEAVYSINEKLILIKFTKIKIKENKFNFITVEGNPIPYNVIKIDSPESYNGILTFENVDIQSEMGKFNIEYGFMTSISNLLNKIHIVKEFAIDFINSNRDLSKYKKYEDKVSYLNYLNELKDEMFKMFSDESTPELKIDKFLENHPIILERALHLGDFKHQVILKNILNKYEHDLKPDLIAYDSLNKKWVIVDYKKAKRNIIKNLNKVRTGFKSDVNDLENQLNDYIEYFEEEKHREYIKKTYKIDIKYPDAIGIIGNISVKEQDAFNRLVKNQPKWFNVMPYNYLYDSFCNYVAHIEGRIY